MHSNFTDSFFDTFQNDKKILSIGRTLTRLTSIKMKNERCFKERKKNLLNIVDYEWPKKNHDAYLHNDDYA